MTPIKSCAALCLTVILSACASSPPVQFFTLDPVAPGNNSAPAASTAVHAPIQVTAVHIPGTLDRREMVRETASDALDISDRHRWAAPLGEMMRRVLTQDLAQRLPAGRVILPQQAPPATTDEIAIDVLQFDSDASGTVHFDGSWSLLRNGSETPLLSRHLKLDAAAGPTDYGSQAKAMSEILGRIADSITAGISGNAQSRPSR